MIDIDDLISQSDSILCDNRNYAGYRIFAAKVNAMLEAIKYYAPVQEWTKINKRAQRYFEELADNGLQDV